MRKIYIFILFIILASFAIGIYFYPVMPAQIASHWGAQGEVNGYMGKFWGLFLMPIISLVMFAFFIALPLLDPMKENYIKFRKYFDGFIALMIGFLFYIYLLTIVWNLGYTYNMMRAITPAMAVIFYAAGILISHSQRNWFVGIRTPWTLSSDKVWDDTHKIGGQLFKACAVISLFGLIFPNLAIWFVLVPVLSASVYITAYSYYDYKKQNKKIDKN